ncbi:lipopolysaccharide assembly protein LapA domain-containing protein [Roseofilum capinflatum]|uniref:Lipopolysaccharide assembly protein LapA domain-containing protein n=1 Tax=Roseofilum capinflatum BLCC-M114 TaxID=3022440 RepID=A0ABT7B920_9CYAN|nr:lipopolysaccharide assembly protein LapA domain-containing protein [Roseofilum capinflatum]MDJ1175099.1 lipopolysaccharide assembly protein LapA domain-containing protein [Roseofilum capinflatum BLCC-M114]
MIARHLSLSLLLSIWISAIAILSVQNATPISLKFLLFESVQIPIGILLAFSASLGLLAGLLIVPWGNQQDRPSPFTEPKELDDSRWD